MSIHASTITVRLIRPRISGEILLHDDQAHTVVPVAIEPTEAPPWFEASPPRGDTVRDDFDDYRRQAERIMQTLLAHTDQGEAEREEMGADIHTAQRRSDSSSDAAYQGKDSRP